jgi:hypothetical protein
MHDQRTAPTTPGLATLHLSSIRGRILVQNFGGVSVLSLGGHRICGRPVHEQEGGDHFIDNDRGQCDPQPQKRLLHRQPTKTVDKQSQHLLGLKAPPLIGHRYGGFPKQTDKQDEQESQTEGTPIDEGTRDTEEQDAGRERHQSQKQEIARKPFVIRLRSKLLVQ